MWTYHTPIKAEIRSYPMIPTYESYYIRELAKVKSMYSEIKVNLACLTFFITSSCGLVQLAQYP